MPGTRVAWKWLPVTNPHGASLPPHWYRWRQILPGLAWGSLKLAPPGLHGCSPGTEEKNMGWQGMGKETPEERRDLAQALAIHPNSRFTLLHS